MTDSISRRRPSEQCLRPVDQEEGPYPTSSIDHVYGRTNQVGLPLIQSMTKQGTSRPA